MKSIENIYNMIIDNVYLTNDTLYDYGFTQEDINEFLSKRLLKKVNNHYEAANIDDVYSYYKKTIKEHDCNKSLRLLDLVLYMKPSHGGALFQKFFTLIRLGNNYEALEVYEIMRKYKVNTYPYDSKMQLFLLSKLINVGDEFYEELNNITIDDVKIPSSDNRYFDIPKQNIAREKVLNYEFVEARDLLYSKKDFTRNITLQELLFKTLLNHIINAYKDGHNYTTCIYEYRYYDALYALKQKESLTDYEALIEKLLNFILYTPDQIFVNYDHKQGLWEAIEANDFENALQISEQFNNDKHISDEESALNMLLQDIVNMLSNCEYKTEDEYNAELNNQEEVVEEVKEETTTEEETQYDYSQVYYISSLINQGLSFDEALEQSGFNNHIKEYVTLVYAKEAFIKGNTKVGDKLLSLFNKNKEKDKANNELYKKIVSSKKFLAFRQSDLESSITLPKIVTRIK